jgi:UDP-sugar diphosphatase
MEDIEDFRVEENFQNSKYIRVTRLHYKQNGVKKDWDFARTHDAVGCLLYHKQKRSFILVKQFRPPVYASNISNEQTKHLGGITYELCAGLIDKEGKSELEICQEEIHEECGFQVPISSIERVTNVCSSCISTYLV